MKKLNKRNNTFEVCATIEAYRSGCSDGCTVTDSECVCFGDTPTAGTTVEVAAQTGSGSCP